METNIKSSHEKLLFFTKELSSIRNEIDHLLSILIKKDSPLLNRYNNELEIILYFTCKYFKISKIETLSKSRQYPLAASRQVYVSIARELFGNKIPLNIIGKIVNIDHSTVLHSLKKMKNAKFTNDKLFDDYEIILDNIKNAFEEFNNNNSNSNIQ